jgi:virginiamycin A acetyltransferase
MKLQQAVVPRLRKLASALRFPELARRGVYVHHASEIGPNTIIGLGTSINGPCFLGSTAEAAVRIGRYCAVGHNLRIRTRNHSTRYANVQDKLQRALGFVDLGVFEGDVVVGNAVWLGDNVIILPGVTIGDGAVIGAGAVVTKDVPPFAMAVGTPAKVLRSRFEQPVIDFLLELRWWDWDEDRIAANKRFFDTDLTAFVGDLGGLIEG